MFLRVNMEKNGLKQKKTEYAAVILLSAVMVAIPLMHYICVKYVVNSNYLAGSIYFLAIICGVFNCVAAYINRNTMASTIYEKTVAAFLLFAVVSAVFAEDVRTALWGQPGREEGLFMLISYCIFFYTARLISDDRIRKIAAEVFLLVQLVHSIYGLMQYFDIYPQKYIIFDSYHYAVSGVAGNPDFMATVMVFSFGISLGLLYKCRRKWEKIVYGAAAVIFLWILILTKTALGLVGLAAVMLVLFISLLKNSKNRCKTAVFLAAALVAAVCVMEFVFHKGISVRVQSLMTQFQAMTDNGFAEGSAASGRFQIWANSFELARHNLLTGIGIDGLLEPYFENYGLMAGQYVDKCHNEFLQILVTMGLPALVSYVSLIVCAADDMICGSKTSPVHFAVMLGFFGYMVQAMFNISVIDVAPYLWIFMGLTVQPLISEDGPDENLNQAD